MNTTDFLSIASAIVPDKTAIVFEGKRYTFAQLNERVNRLANGLRGLGVKKGDVVSFIQVNCNQCVETYFAVAKTGTLVLRGSGPPNTIAQNYFVAYDFAHIRCGERVHR